MVVRINVSLTDYEYKEFIGKVVNNSARLRDLMLKGAMLEKELEMKRKFSSKKDGL